MTTQSIHIAGLPVIECRTKFWLEVEGRFAIGEGGFALLRAIARHGSLAEGAKDVGWSYRHAWGYLRRAESVLNSALTTRRSGKGQNRGLDHTPAAVALLGKAIDGDTRLPCAR